MGVRHEELVWLELIRAQEADARAEAYKRGIRHGRALAPDDLVNHEPALRLELSMFESSKGTVRAFALGALRGYRQATDRP